MTITLSTALGAGWLLLGFMAVLALTRVVPVSRRIFASATAALALLGDPIQTDLGRETGMRRLAWYLLRDFLWVTVGLLAALLLPLVMLSLLATQGWVNVESVLALTLSPLFIIVVSVLMLLVWWVWRRWQVGKEGPSDTSQRSTSEYGLADRWVHRIAFATRDMQLALAKREGRWLRHQFSVGAAPAAPVFVAGLPRAGTTLLLELLEASGQFVTHTYRHMPFVLTPLLWARLSRRWQREAQMRQRAHGDGMLVSVESPEAFEEMLWCPFWQKQYSVDHIEPWHPRFSHPQFETFWRDHMAKLVALAAASVPTGSDPASGTNASGLRYLSKNNLNIARLAYIKKAFPDARIVVPFRSPLQHASSLLKQHRQFLELHQHDDFAREYMRAIGHFDFGANLLPINFARWLEEGAAELDPLTLEFWLRYWLVTYRTVRALPAGTVTLFCYEDFCRAPTASLQGLAAELAVADPTSLLAGAQRVALAPPHPLAADGLDPELLAEAEKLYEALREQAVNGVGSQS